MCAQPTPTHPASVHRARGHRPRERALQDTSGGDTLGATGPALHHREEREGSWPCTELPAGPAPRWAHPAAQAQTRRQLSEILPASACSSLGKHVAGPQLSPGNSMRHAMR